MKIKMENRYHIDTSKTDLGLDIKTNTVNNLSMMMLICIKQHQSNI